MPGEADGFNCPLPLFGASLEPATLDLPGAGMPVEGGGIVGKGRVGGPLLAGAGRVHGAGAGVAAGAAFGVTGVWV